MINRIVLICVVAYSLTSCSDKTKFEKTMDEVPGEELFNSAYDTLENLEIPLTLRPDKWDHLYVKHLEKYGVKEGSELLKHPYAMLTESKAYKAIIFVANDETSSPTLITIDRSGRPIDTLSLLGDWAGNDASIATTEIATIDSDLTIHLLDSILTFDLTPDGDRIENTERLTITDAIYKRLDSGIIEKMQ